MGIKITSVNESLKDNGLKVLVHGEAGAGKTTMGATAGVPTLIISAESGLLSIKDAPDYIQVTEIKSMEDLDEVYNYLKNNDHGFEWIVLDSISEMGEVCLAAEKASSRDGRAAYANMIDAMTKQLKQFRNLPVNVMMTCKQQKYEDQETGVTKYLPQLPGNRLANDLPYLFDLVLALRVEKDEEGHNYRICQTGTDLRYVAKDRSGMLDMFEKPSLKHIFSKAKGKFEGLSKPEPEKAEKKKDDQTTRWFYHPESDSAIVVKPGDDVPDVPDLIELDSEDEYKDCCEAIRARELAQQVEEEAGKDS